MKELIESIGYTPKKCVWELTRECNLTCLHCGTRVGKARNYELNTTEAKRVINELKQLGCERITISGGEPLLRKDWHKVCEYASSKDIKVNLITNGLLFNKESANIAKDVGLVNIGFSLDGLENTNDFIRKNGSFYSIENSMNICCEKEIKFAVITHINKLNHKELEVIYSYLLQYIPFLFAWQVQLGNSMGNMLNHDDLALPPESLIDIIPRLAKLILRGELRIDVGDNIGYYGPYEKTLRKSLQNDLKCWLGCYAGCRVIGIESDGGVKGCLTLPSKHTQDGDDKFVEGNILKDSLIDIWNRPGAFKYNREFKMDALDGFCRSCEYAELCRGGCRWMSIGKKGTKIDNKYCYHQIITLNENKDIKKRKNLKIINPALVIAMMNSDGLKI